MEGLDKKGDFSLDQLIDYGNKLLFSQLRSRHDLSTSVERQYLQLHNCWCLNMDVFQNLHYSWKPRRK